MAGKKKVVSYEENMEDKVKQMFKSYNLPYYTKTESVNSDIDGALQKAPSKSGGSGNNYPDIKHLVITSTGRQIPVMIEVKGKKNAFIKQDDKTGDILLEKVITKDTKTRKKGEIDTTNVEKYAVNGAVHYAMAILNHSSYKECLAIGINGYLEEGIEYAEYGVYYISAENYNIPKEVDKYTDLSFLKKSNLDEFVKKLDELSLTPEEREQRARVTEADLDAKLRKINQVMQDTLQINVNYRVNLIAGMLMAGLGSKDEDGNCEVAPLDVDELKGAINALENDGRKLLDKIRAFLNSKNLPDAKKAMIVNILSTVFTGQSDLYTPVNGESKLKSIYHMIKEEIVPIFNSSHHLDFTGKLFNVLNEWVAVPDGDKNDVVLTPRYVTDLMAKLTRVDMNSYVWDYCTGSAGFLVSSMKLMLMDAKGRLGSPEEYRKKELEIKSRQLLGIEKLPDIYMLAVLNMLLMGDGSSQILHMDSLKYNGTCGVESKEEFPATVFLLNPPYSASGKGFIFVQRALERMKSGYAAILIQENAGSGQGLPYTKEILEQNTLLASIHMANIFCGKAGVQTAIYVFKVHEPHNVDHQVKFIDFSNDGYTRQNRKKSNQDVNLKNTDHAIERYQEVVDLVLDRKRKTNYLTTDEFFTDTISLSGDDWTFSQHKKIDTTPTEEDFRRTVADYLAWKVSQAIREGNCGV